MKEIGHLFGLSYSMVSRIVNRDPDSRFKMNRPGFRGGCLV